MTKISLFISRFIASVMMLITLGGALTATILVATPATVYAQQSCGTSNDRLPSFGANCVGGLATVKGDRGGIANIIQTFANFFIFILAAISVLFIVYGGFMYVTDDGSGEKAKKGQKMVLNALIGLVVAVVSFTLVSLVVNLVSTLNVGSAATSGPNQTSGGPGMINIL